jgi:microcystin-dependent protein
VDSLGAKPLRSAPGVELSAGVLSLGTPYAATYATTNSGEWILHGFYGNPYNVPIGGGMIYLGTTAPNSNFVFPYGQALSRTTYATLFGQTSTAFGAGDGSTTFNILDLRGRLPVGKDDMGGTAASRVTTAVSGVDGTTMGAAGGGQSLTIAQANLPNVNLTLTSGQFSYGSSLSTTAGLNYATGGSGPPLTNASLNTTPNPALTVPLGGSGTALGHLPPSVVVPWIIRVI